MLKECGLEINCLVKSTWRISGIHITCSPNCEVLTLLVKTDKYGKVEDTEAEKKNIDYREEEIPDCGCIYG